MRRIFATKNAEHAKRRISRGQWPRRWRCASGPRRVLGPATNPWRAWRRGGQNLWSTPRSAPPLSAPPRLRGSSDPNYTTTRMRLRPHVPIASLKRPGIEVTWGRCPLFPLSRGRRGTNDDASYLGKLPGDVVPSFPSPAGTGERGDNVPGFHRGAADPDDRGDAEGRRAEMNRSSPPRTPSTPSEESLGASGRGPVALRQRAEARSGARDEPLACLASWRPKPLEHAPFGAFALRASASSAVVLIRTTRRRACACGPTCRSRR
jgi:hypothetical protein